MLAVVGLAMLSAVVIVPAFSRRYLLLRHHRVLTIGTLVFTTQALHMNLSHSFGYYSPGILSSAGFAVLLLSLGYTAMGMIVENEHRLLSIDSELALARQLQFSILPAEVPAISRLRIAAKYLPMTAVAGDFYHFIPVDDHRVGILVADVSGHGVPAALIASMIKTAMHSIHGCSNEPSEVLRRLGKVLSVDLKGQFVSAAYLWLDTETRKAKYAAAGHPPLLLWHEADCRLERIESNGLIFGVVPDFEIPQLSLELCPGDRLLLYTDGVTEPENQAGEAFGDQRLEQVIRNDNSRSASQLSERLVTEIRAWVPSSTRQQDDLTLIVVDVL
jgi:sigma-B regulation protein RsbU (phosphoserine phosphatase)